MLGPHTTVELTFFVGEVNEEKKDSTESKASYADIAKGRKIGSEAQGSIEPTNVKR